MPDDVVAAPKEEKKYFDDDGNEISKNAFKKLETQKKKAAERAEKDAKAAAKAAAQPASSKKKVEEEEELDPTKYRENRIAQISALADPYPHKWPVTHSVGSLRAKYEATLKAEDKREDVVVCIAGRVVNKRSSGKNLHFYTIQADESKIQIMSTPQDWKVGAIAKIFARFIIHDVNDAMHVGHTPPERNRAGPPTIQGGMYRS